MDSEREELVKKERQRREVLANQEMQRRQAAENQKILEIGKEAVRVNVYLRRSDADCLWDIAEATKKASSLFCKWASSATTSYGSDQKRADVG